MWSFQLVRRYIEGLRWLDLSGNSGLTGLPSVGRTDKTAVI